MNEVRQRVVGAVLTNGDRFQYLCQVLSYLEQDEYITDIVIVDNNSKSEEAIRNFTENSKKKIRHIRNNKNYGSAGGFYQCIKESLETECEYMLLLDDDAVPKKDSIKHFFNIYSLFTRHEKKIILVGNRVNIGDNDMCFYKRKIDVNVSYNLFGTFWRLSNIFNFLSNVFNHKKRLNKNHFLPVLPTTAAAYGATFFPLCEMRKIDKLILPDPKLFLYGDDVDFSWGLRKNGFKIYVCTLPIITYVHNTMQNKTFFEAMCDKDMQDFKVYLLIRNRVLVTLKDKRFLKKIPLIINSTLWIFAFIFLCVIKNKFSYFLLHRIKVFLLAHFNGIISNYKIPNTINFPEDAEILEV